MQNISSAEWERISISFKAAVSTALGKAEDENTRRRFFIEANASDFPPEYYFEIGMRNQSDKGYKRKVTIEEGHAITQLMVHITDEVAKYGPVRRIYMARNSARGIMSYILKPKYEEWLSHSNEFKELAE